MTVLEMKQKRAEAQRKMNNILDKAQKESRAMNEGEVTDYGKLKDEVRDWTNKIDTMEAWLAGQKPEPKKAGRKFSYVRAIRAMLERKEFDEPEKVIDGIGRRSMGDATKVRDNSLVIPMQKRAALQAAIAEQGKEDVATDLLDLVTPLENKLIAAQAGCTFLTGLQGNIEIPFYTGTTTAWGGELDEAKDGSGQFKKKTLAPLRISGYVDISRQLLIQANDSVDAFIQTDLVNSVQQTVEKTMFSSEAATETSPAGLLYGVTAETEAPTYGSIIDMETELNKNNFDNLTFVGAYDALGVLRQTPKVPNFPAYLMENGLIDGRPVYGSNNVASKGLILGDFSELTIGQWGGIELLVDPYTQATKATVRLVVNAYFNYFVRRGYNKKGGDIIPFVKKILK